LLLLIIVLWLLSRLTAPKTEREEYPGITPPSPTPEVKKSRTSASPGRVVSPRVREADDLTIIEGIGPEISKVLADNGITTFAQLAGVKVIILEAILKDARLQMAYPSTWSQQAALAAEGKWEELQELKQSLVRGRLSMDDQSK
ncbi:MAG: hypothetical protein P1S60_14225, partial [Anaerolineae bacterium]|nr:hypothetical protein [Anaerolineae bacterium]